MANINYDYYKGITKYDDGNVENELLSFYDGKINLDLNRDDIFYVLTDIRENIINWYPFKKNSEVLEIGGGTGPITGVLCRKAKHVVSVENSKRRAEIIYKRNAKYENLDVYAGNFQDVQYNQKFDYIVLVGVFEYTKIFFDTKNPFEDFLNSLKKMLNKNGKIIIAIENRYGIKYFSGVTEDHYAKKYIGLKGYENLNIQTFGKGEWINLLNKCGLKNYKFYYPFPDYKMPFYIFSDKRKPLATETEKLNIFNYGPEIYDYDYRKILNGIIENNMFDFFSNSFFIEIAKDETNLCEIDFAKIQTNRSNNYKHITYISGNKIWKEPIYDGKYGLENLLEIHKKLKKSNLNIANIECVKSKYFIEKIQGELLSEQIYSNFKKNDKDKIYDLIDKFYKYLVNNSVLKKFTNPLSDDYKKIWNKVNIMNFSLLDLNMSNVIYNDNKFYLFDQEFMSDKEIPLEYIFYFSINNLYSQISKLESLISKEKLLKKYGISKKIIKVLEKSAFEYFESIGFYDHIKEKHLLKVSNIILTENVIKDLEENNDFKRKEIEKITSDYSNLDRDYKEILEYNKMLLKIIKNRENEFKDLKKEYDDLHNIHNNVVNSKSWRFLQKVKKILKLERN